MSSCSSWFLCCCSVTSASANDVEKVKGSADVGRLSAAAAPAAAVSTATPPTQPRRGSLVGAHGGEVPKAASAGDARASGSANGNGQIVATLVKKVGQDGETEAEAKRRRVEDFIEAEVQQEADTMSVVSMNSVASCRSGRSTGTTSSIASSVINERIPARQIQQNMKAFVRKMVRGQSMGVVSPDGQLRTCTGSLDKRLKHFVIELKGSAKKIPLTSVAEVYQGLEPEDIDTPLDNLCATLTLEGGECITFHFDDIPARENFAMCLQLLIDGQR